MEKQEFYELAKNRNKYKVLKKLDGELAYAEIGNTYFSDTLFERGYNIIELCKTGYLELVPRVFDFEKDVVGKNIHSVLSVCPECGSHGVNMPLEKQCGNCGYTECWTYYDAETIDNLLPKTVATEDKKAPVQEDETAESVLLRRGVHYTIPNEIKTVTVKSALQAMREYASQERNRAIQECITVVVTCAGFESHSVAASRLIATSKELGKLKKDS
jgi:ribosomal protein L37E